MKQFKGTPGPWELRVEAMDQTVALDVIGDGVMVSSATPWSSDTECDIDKAIANANLIAAAPELLEALQEFVDLFPDVIDGDAIMPALDMAEAAINKALGESC